MKRSMTMRELQDWGAWYNVSPLACVGLGLGLGLGSGDGPPPGPPQTVEEQQAIWETAAAAFGRARKESG